MFKKIQLLALVAGLIVSLACAGNVFARGTSNIAATIHNLSTSGPDSLGGGPYQELFEDRICIFCHTPHAGQLNTPLWNRDLSTLTGKNYDVYTSATLSSELTGMGANRTINAESLLCLSCHDGSLAVGDIVNASKGTPWLASNFILGIGGIPGAQIGASPGDVGATNTNDLTDDHPISFDYDAVQTEKPLDFIALTLVDSDLHFAGTGASKNRLECSTCHDPHVDYIAEPEFYPFLAKDNAASALCLSCHIK